MKDCGHHKHEELIKKIIIGVVLSVAILAFIIIILWHVYKPTKPEFILQDATLHALNLTGPTELTSIIHVTIQARNPNNNVGLYYSHMISFASYRDQQITVPVQIPPAYQVSRGVNIWSPFLQGYSEPIAPYIGAQINQDRLFGGIRFVIKLDGSIRWKVGSITTGSYGIHICCPALIPFGSNGSSDGSSVWNNAVKYSLLQHCSVDV